MFLVFLGLTTPVFANPPKSEIYFDFENMQIYSRGIYQPQNAKNHRLDPIMAEVSARKNGIKNAVKYFDNTCSNINNSALKITPNISKSFRSQGTEIYANGFLEVNLRASYNALIKAKISPNTKTESGEKVIFALPSKLSAKSLVCGTPTFVFMDNQNNNQTVQLVPAKTQKTLASGEKVIKLKFDNAKNALVAASQADAELMQKVAINFTHNGNTFIPITVYTH